MHSIEIWGDEDAEGYPVCDKRALERGLHGSRLSEWRPALDLLLKRKAINVGMRLPSLTPRATKCCLTRLILPAGNEPKSRSRLGENHGPNARFRWVRNKILERGGAIPDEL